jgi:hypothetical protein
LTNARGVGDDDAKLEFDKVDIIALDALTDEDGDGDGDGDADGEATGAT